MKKKLTALFFLSSSVLLSEKTYYVEKDTHISSSNPKENKGSVKIFKDPIIDEKKFLELKIEAEEVEKERAKVIKKESQIHLGSESIKARTLNPRVPFKAQEKPEEELSHGDRGEDYNPLKDKDW